MPLNEPTAKQPDYDAIYPEHAKLKKVSERSQEIGQFLEWLQGEKQYVIASWLHDDMDNAYLTPVHYSISPLLAEYFNIDLKIIEQEKRAMIESMREANDQ